MCVCGSIYEAVPACIPEYAKNEVSKVVRRALNQIAPRWEYRCHLSKLVGFDDGLDCDLGKLVQSTTAPRISQPTCTFIPKWCMRQFATLPYRPRLDPHRNQSNALCTLHPRVENLALSADFLLPA